MIRKKRNNGDNPRSGQWLTTYSDVVTLLLTFFVLLFTFSTLDAQKWQEVVISLTGGTGVLEGGNIINNLDDGAYYNNYNRISSEDMIARYPDKNIGSEDYTDEFLELYRNIGLFLEKKEIPAEVEINKEYTEILIRFKDSILFDTGRADIKPNALDILDGIAEVLNAYQDDIDQIRVDGHADSRPINTYLYPTNWELSSKRAVNVVRYFQEQKGLEPSKLSAAAYASFHPIDSNDTEEGMARNRRVEIYIVRLVKPTETINTEKE